MTRRSAAKMNGTSRFNVVQRVPSRIDTRAAIHVDGHDDFGVQAPRSRVLAEFNRMQRGDSVDAGPRSMRVRCKYVQPGCGTA
jgi:hypothetical protein